MRVLKAAIIIMGVFILAGYAYLGVEVMKRFANHEARDTAKEAREATAEERTITPPTGGEVALGLPRGARIGGMVAAGNRVVVHVTIPEGPDRLYTLDPRTGAIIATLSTGGVTP